MTKFIARLSLFLNNVFFFVSVVFAVGIGATAYESFGAGRPLESLALTTLFPLAIVVTATLLCSIIALLGAIWISIEEANEASIPHAPKEKDRIDPTFSGSR